MRRFQVVFRLSSRLRVGRGSCVPSRCHTHWTDERRDFRCSGARHGSQIHSLCRIDGVRRLRAVLFCLREEFQASAKHFVGLGSLSFVLAPDFGAHDSSSLLVAGPRRRTWNHNCFASGLGWRARIHRPCGLLLCTGGKHFRESLKGRRQPKRDLATALRSRSEPSLRSSGLEILFHIQRCEDRAVLPGLFQQDFVVVRVVRVRQHDVRVAVDQTG